MTNIAIYIKKTYEIYSVILAERPSPLIIFFFILYNDNITLLN